MGSRIFVVGVVNCLVLVVSAISHETNSQPVFIVWCTRDIYIYSLEKR